MGSSVMLVVMVVGSIASFALIGLLLWTQRGAMSVSSVDFHGLSRMFMERTGYRLAEMPDAPIDEQASVIVSRQTDPTNAQQGYEIRYVQDRHGRQVVLSIYTKMVDVRSSWTVPLSAPPRVAFHILKKTKAEPIYPQRVTMGDPRWDGPFEVYGQDPAAVQQALGASGLVDLLENAVAVDLRVYGDQVVFLDPRNANVNASMGGWLGTAAVGGDYVKLSEMTIAAYNQITDIVLLAAETAR